MNILHCWRAALACIALFCGVAQAQPAPGSIQITPIVTAGLSGPVGVMNSGDGSRRLFVIQQGGAIRIVRNGALLATPYLTLNGSTQCRETVGGTLFTTGFTVGGEQGLLGLAFHPQFETNGHFFVSYSGAAGDSIVARFTASVPGADVVPAGDQQSCLVVLRVDQDFANHNGGNIVFGPGGLLYFGLGDGGSGNDPCSRGQTLNPADLPLSDGIGGCASDTTFTAPGGGQPNRPAITRALLGKMLRIDVDGTTAAGANGLCGARLDGGANYAIPADNPFSGADPQSGCDEVWMYGLRNPWRWSFDRQTNDFIIGDVGQDTWEEVSFFSAIGGGGRGANADWKICEARHVRGSCTNLCAAPDIAEVIIGYNNSGGCANPTPITGVSVTGGYRYRGPDVALRGVYFFGDAGRTDIYYSVENGGNWTQPGPASTIVGAAGGVVVAFGEDEFGALYVIGGGNLTRIGAAPDPDVIFADGFE